jgi:predicted RNA-binding protein Jag
MDVTINVGLGTGQAQEKMQFLAQIAGKQEQLLQTMGQNNPMVTLPQYAATLEKMIEAAGFKDTETFVNRPSQVTQIAQQMAQQAAQNKQQPQLDPVAQAELQMKQMEAQARIEDSRARLEMEREKITAEMELARAKMEAEIQLNREKALAQIDLRRAELAEEAQLEAIKMSANLPGGQGNINMNN